MLKICPKCKIEKEKTKENYIWRPDKNKWESKCRDCIKKYKQEYYLKNQERLKEKSRKHHHENSEKIKIKKSIYFKQSNNKDKFDEWFEENKDFISKGYKIRYGETKKEYFKRVEEEKIRKREIKNKKNREYEKRKREKNKENKRKYFEENKEKILLQKEIEAQKRKEKIKEARRERRKIPTIKLRHHISKAILEGLKTRNQRKKGSCLLYLPYSIKELKSHLESLWEPWMNWDNYGPYKKATWDDNDQSTWTWQIDHIVPHSTFDYQSMEDEEFQKCWSLENLRPLNSKQNVIDGARRSRH